MGPCSRHPCSRDEALIARRLAAQRLTGPPAASAVDAVRHLLAVQGQDSRGARLAVRARTAGLTAADVDRALTDDRSLLITWLNRGTLHLVTAEDYWWLHPLTAPLLATGIARRLAQEGIPPADGDRGVRAVEQALASDGPLTRAQLRERIAAAGVRTEGQALVYILALASLRGLIVRGPMTGRDHAFVLVRDWLGKPPAPLPRERALAELTLRYLAGHGPASDRDLAKWAGLPLRDARRGLAEAAGGLEKHAGGLAGLAGGSPGYGLPPPRLLGAFDPLLLGWESRADIAPPDGPVVTSNGLFRPFALVGGRAAALWTVTAGKVVAPQLPLDGPDAAALAAEAADVARFLGLPGHGQTAAAESTAPVKPVPRGCTG